MDIITSHDDFVGIYDNAFSPEFCDRLIKYYEWNAVNNRVWDRPEPESIKKDKSVAINPCSIEELDAIDFSEEKFHPFLKEFNDVFWDKCYADYISTYSVLADYDRHTIFTYKIQKTLPAGGYHVWHAEDCGSQFSKRIGVYILYLNDDYEGGETEFLYLSRRITPKKGRLVIFPPNYPWAHRGNPPLTGEKYIMTGWTEFK